jgi:Cu(I)/Ag(I) efflux system membrane fusion protein/cobalt-zinc-cadmium efflux system membrane fusion protein
VTYDETKLAHVHTKVDGYIEKAYVQATGTRVKAGQPLVEIYSPDLVSTQEEYLQAYRSARRAQAGLQAVQDLLESARRRLELWDISDTQITRLEQTGTVTETMTLNSPFDGVVVFTEAIEGMHVKPAMHLYKIADLSRVWVEADIYEYELPWIEEGQQVVVNQSYVPGKEYVGHVDYIYPYMESKTRTVKVRSIFENRNGELKPGMYVNMEIHSEIDANAVTLPEESIIFSGTRAIAFVSLGDGRFEPRNVELGPLSGDGYYQVYNGVHTGEKVVTSGQFLLDSESKLQEALQKMVARNESGEGSSAVIQEHNH